MPTITILYAGLLGLISVALAVVIGRVRGRQSAHHSDRLHLGDQRLPSRSGTPQFSAVIYPALARSHA
jgi:hypothetical protein